MILHFPKLYKNNRSVNSYIGIPYKMGERSDALTAQVYQNGNQVLTQEKITARYMDGSVKYSFVRFACELPANKGTELACEFIDADLQNGMVSEPLLKKEADGSYLLKNAYLSVLLKDNATSLFQKVSMDGKQWEHEQFQGPFVKDEEGALHGILLGAWEICENGPVYARLKVKGTMPGSDFAFECNVSMEQGSKAVEVAFRIINASEKAHEVRALWFAVMEKGALLSTDDSRLDMQGISGKVAADSTGCGDAAQTVADEMIAVTTGTGKLAAIEEEIDLNTIRTCVGKSNYKTTFTIGKKGQAVQYLVDADYLIGEANEHFAEVFYGTFFADRTDGCGGVCATIYQAQQNFPKAVRADGDGIYVMLVPEHSEQIVMNGGMSREQKFSLLFHDPSMTLEEMDDLSLRYQMPDRPYLSPEVFHEAGVMPEIFTNPSNWREDVEIALVGKADAHGRAYGMLNWGDAPDSNYTTQGRGNGMQVWTNNEYDYPHACALQYARTGERRFLDYCITSVRHWMDVDVCHFSNDPLRLGGQWEHCARHNAAGIMVCSHEWVEGLLDYYHFTGDERGLETALGIGENVLRLLETPMYQVPGEANARETGWALRSLTALYVETGDPKWTTKCEWIVDQFKVWKETYGEWLAPYTDNTLIRTGFMISVAIGSLMRYYRVFPSQELKELMLSAVDDLIENATLPYGLFYYKELPSLNRLGNNTLLLEALTIGYELTGDVKYLLPGKRTFERAIASENARPGGTKRHVEDAVLLGSTSPKSFAQQMLPLTTYYVAMLKEGL